MANDESGSELTSNTKFNIRFGRSVSLRIARCWWWQGRYFQRRFLQYDVWSGYTWLVDGGPQPDGFSGLCDSCQQKRMLWSVFCWSIFEIELSYQAICSLPKELERTRVIVGSTNRYEIWYYYIRFYQNSNSQSVLFIYFYLILHSTSYWKINFSNTVYSYPSVINSKEHSIKSYYTIYSTGSPRSQWR